MTTKPLAIALGALLGLCACDLDIGDLNAPGLEPLEAAPTAVGINTAAVGLQIGTRAGKAPTVGLVNQLGILGREAYCFDPADNRFVTELIQGSLNRSSPFGGGAAFWLSPYANIRLANIILNGLDKVKEFSAEDKAGLKGFAYTIQALDLLTVIVARDDIGAIIDTNKPLGAPLAPFVKGAEVYAEIARLLDLAVTELNAAGKAFSFRLSPGFAGFSDPAGFLKVNRAIRARVAVYQKDYATALTALAASFIDDTAAPKFQTGAFHTYSTNPGDAVNTLINVNILAHPALETDAQLQADMTPDARYVAKITKLMSPVGTGSDTEIKSALKFKIYPLNTTPITLIRNEELVLLKAEALWFTGDKAGSMAALNLVRTVSGKLPPLAEPADATAFTDALLYERRYSLMFEGGHRWIDLKRFGRQLPLDVATHTRNVRYPIPTAECDARPGEPACNINSSDPIAQ
jgi:starch-binding outer membrane protein, SusD/RagB family